MKTAVHKGYTIVVEKDENDLFIGEIKELPGCHTQAKTYSELLKRMEEAVSLYLS